MAASHPDLARDIFTEANYFENNQKRVRYPKFCKQDLFVGSGIIEAGCKPVLGRLKRSGMFWAVHGANAIIALHCCQLSGKFEDYWPDGRKSHFDVAQRVELGRDHKTPTISEPYLNR